MRPSGQVQFGYLSDYTLGRGLYIINTRYYVEGSNGVWMWSVRARASLHSSACSPPCAWLTCRPRDCEPL